VAKMRNDGGVLLGVRNFYVRIKIRVRHSVLIIPSLIARMQSIAASIEKLPDSIVKSVGRARHRH
jgi:hypothetical protein